MLVREARTGFPCEPTLRLIYAQLKRCTNWHQNLFLVWAVVRQKQPQYDEGSERPLSFYLSDIRIRGGGKQNAAQESSFTKYDAGVVVRTWLSGWGGLERRPLRAPVGLSDLSVCVCGTGLVSIVCRCVSGNVLVVLVDHPVHTSIQNGRLVSEMRCVERV